MKTHQITRSVIHPFPTLALNQAHELKLRDELLKKRIEAQGLTIDPENPHDSDDAIWIERNGNGYLAHVSVSDISALVKEGSFVDNEAFKRAFSVFYGSRNRYDPMFPQILSEDRLSFLRGEPRLAITVTIPISENLDIGKPEIKFTYLVSKKRLTYDEADHIIQKRSGEHSDVLILANEIARKLLLKRSERGLPAIYDIEKRIVTNEEGEVVDMSEEDAHSSSLLIQEFMILANETIARFVSENNIPTLFRNHEGALQRAIYGPVNMAHYGLDLSAYVHFTSPVRRYPDGVVQRNLHDFFEERPFTYSYEKLEEIATYINKRQRRKKHFYARAHRAGNNQNRFREKPKPKQDTSVATEIRSMIYFQGKHSEALDLLCKAFGWEKPTYEINDIGNPRLPKFLCKGVVTIRDIPFQGDGVYNKKNTAKEFAAKELIRKIWPLAYPENPIDKLL